MWCMSMLVNHSVNGLVLCYRCFTSMILQLSIYHLEPICFKSGEPPVIPTMKLVLTEAVTMCWTKDWHKFQITFSSHHMQEFISHLEQMFWFHSGRFQDSWKTKSFFWIEKSHFPFCSTILVYITRTFGVFDPDNSKLRGHQPRLKCSMLLSGKKMLWEDMHNGECIPNVFLWAPVGMSCLFAMLPSTAEKAFFSVRLLE